MVLDSHQQYLDACEQLGFAVFGYQTDPALVEIIREHLQGGPHCMGCENDTMQSGPDHTGEVILLAHVRMREKAGEMPARVGAEMMVTELIHLIELKYGGRSADTIIERFQEAKDRERARRAGTEAA